MEVSRTISETERILNQIEYGVVVVNRKSLKIIKINEAARKMFSLPEIDESFNLISYIQGKFKINVSDNGFFYFEGEAADTCNRIFEVYTKFVCTPVTEGADMIVAIIRDVTDIKAREIKRLDTLGVIAYKLKTRISETKASLRLLKEQGAVKDPDESSKQILDALNDHCRKLDELAGELLLFTES
ncbi:MAG: hypothetical protein PHE30_02535 [Candidatus Omnitrophica bacterium]|nr:hypothetical protein [Candidatus Omnitrophota bacterium]MDD5027421.1 hypothetical protein [Candidatus Omnitrophota bacterium]MDD5506567.1 hypothetical protein [Candidatus Omnitrophota bacterium]